MSRRCATRRRASTRRSWNSSRPDCARSRAPSSTNRPTIAPSSDATLVADTVEQALRLVAELELDGAQRPRVRPRPPGCFFQFALLPGIVFLSEKYSCAARIASSVTRRLVALRTCAAKEATRAIVVRLACRRPAARWRRSRRPGRASRRCRCAAAPGRRARPGRRRGPSWHGSPGRSGARRSARRSRSNSHSSTNARPPSTSPPAGSGSSSRRSSRSSHCSSNARPLSSSSSTVKPGGRPASMGKSNSTRRANACSVPIGAWSRRSSAAAALLGRACRQGAREHGCAARRRPSR